MADGKPFTVLVLLFGDYPQLAERCLKSVFNFDYSLVADVRIGLNAVSSATRALVESVAVDDKLDRLLVYDAGDCNHLKYPVMRKMLYDSAHPIDTQYVMWFDDDSFVTASDKRWWRIALNHIAGAQLLGFPYTLRAKGRQSFNVMQQPWYNDKPLTKQHRFSFMTGGFWVADMAMLQQWDYPFTAITHNGGDVMLGELCRQRNYIMRRMPPDLVAVNADDSGKPSVARRRGESRPPVWSVDVSDYDSHSFTLDAYDPRLKGKSGNR